MRKHLRYLLLGFEYFILPLLVLIGIGVIADWFFRLEPGTSILVLITAIVVLFIAYCVGRIIGYRP